MKTNRRRSGPPQAHGPAGQPAQTRTDYSQTGPRTAKRTEETGRGRERKDAYPVRRSLQPDQDWAWNPGIPWSLPVNLTSGNQGSLRGSILVWVSAFQVLDRSICSGLVARISSSRPACFKAAMTQVRSNQLLSETVQASGGQLHNKSTKKPLCIYDHNMAPVRTRLCNHFVNLAGSFLSPVKFNYCLRWNTNRRSCC